MTWQPAAATQSIPVPERRFTYLHVDWWDCSLLRRRGSSTSSPSLTGLPDGWKPFQSRTFNMEAATIEDALVTGWVSCFGVPAVITSDRGTQFMSAVWEALCKHLNIQHITTTAFHPCSNGMVDRCHRQLKEALRARSAANDWPDHLPWVLLGMRAAPKEDSAVSSAEMVLGEPLVLPRQPPAAEPPPQWSYRGAQPYEAPATGPIRAPGGAGGVLERLREERRQSVAICGVVRRALRGPRARREGVPAAGRRQRGGGVCGPPQAAHADGASAASGAAEARSAARVGRLVYHCRLQMSALRRVLWRHRSLVYVVAFYP